MVGNAVTIPFFSPNSPLPSLQPAIDVINGTKGRVRRAFSEEVRRSCEEEQLMGFVPVFNVEAFRHCEISVSGHGGART
jgi:hypothetical protein